MEAVIFDFDSLFGINNVFIERFYSQTLHDAVAQGNINDVEELLNEPGSDINTVYFGESLLWTAIMNSHEEMARFLIDNGIDTTFSCCRIEILDPDKKEDDFKLIKSSKVRIATTPQTRTRNNNKSEDKQDTPSTTTADVYRISCRQLAYEKELYEIVNYIDYIQGTHARWLDPPAHEPRLTKSSQLKLRQEKDLLALPTLSDKHSITFEPPLFTVSKTPSQRGSPCKSEVLHRSVPTRQLQSSLSVPERFLFSNRQETPLPSSIPPRVAFSSQSTPIYPALTKTCIMRSVVTASDYGLRSKHPEYSRRLKPDKARDIIRRQALDNRLAKSAGILQSVEEKLAETPRSRRKSRLKYLTDCSTANEQRPTKPAQKQCMVMRLQMTAVSNLQRKLRVHR